MYLIDDEGQIVFREINIAVSKKNGGYPFLQVIYTWRTENEFKRFMRFADRYAKNNVLVYESNNNT